MPDHPGGDPRVFLAIDRTFLAWTRTALALMGFGFVVARLGLFLEEVATSATLTGAPEVTATSEHSLSLWLGIALVIAGVVLQVLALAEHHRLTRTFRMGKPVIPPERPLATVAGLFLVGVGVAVAAYLVALS